MIDIVDVLGPGGKKLGESDYEAFIAGGDPDFEWKRPTDEWNAIALNYTSGTTGDAKGVVYHHRGAALLAVGNVVTGGMKKHPVYLWTLPMLLQRLVLPVVDLCRGRNACVSPPGAGIGDVRGDRGP